MTKDEALKLALEALEEACELIGPAWAWRDEKGRPAITAIKETLAQPEQEPVAIHQCQPLYTHPVKDLEDIDINITWNENSMRDFGKDELNFARAILGKAQDGYVAPQRTWVGLSEQEHTELAIECGCLNADWVFYGAALERKIKEKNEI